MLKINYSANITQIIDFYGITKTQAGTVPTFFFFAYGIGQVFNGVFCKKYNIKWMIFVSLFVSASINLIIAVGSNFYIIKWLWLANGFVLSILWPTIVRLLSEVLPKKVLGTSSVVMGTTVAVGTLIVYGLSSIFAAFDKFKLSFYTAGIAVTIVAVIWAVLYNKAVECAKNEKEQEETVEKTNPDAPLQEHQKKGERKLLFASIYVLCFFAIGVNLIKDGLTTWVPSILKEEFSMSDSLSILLTLFLPIIAVFGNAVALKMHEKIPDYVNQCAMVFAIIAVFIGVIIESLTLELIIIMLFGLVIVNFLASSLNSLITSIFPMFMRGKVNSGLFAGVLNGFCYLGSTISSYGLGAIADNFGWNAVFWTLMVFCIVTFIVWCGYACMKTFYTTNSN
ncbi:MAG: MFS transporter [Clostridia bacterium]|nr:MFS transporter [Clostridia bacterium]